MCVAAQADCANVHRSQRLPLVVLPLLRLPALSLLAGQIPAHESWVRQVRGVFRVIASPFASAQDKLREAISRPGAAILSLRAQRSNPAPRNCRGHGIAAVAPRWEVAGT